MNCKDIIKAYLINHSYDGLYTDDCGCRIDDLIPCGGCCDNCMPGVKQRMYDHEYGGTGEGIGPVPEKPLPTIEEMSGSIPGIGGTVEDEIE